jgi:hypothetical protein
MQTALPAVLKATVKPLQSLPRAILSAGSGRTEIGRSAHGLVDWIGISSPFDEAFAHCADGTTYWGRVLDYDKVHAMLRGVQAHEMNAQNELTRALRNRQMPSAPIAGLAQVLLKDVLNRAVRLKTSYRMCPA